MKSTNTNITAERNKTANASPWVWLLSAQSGDSDALRLASYDSAVTFDGLTYAPFPFTIGHQTEDTQGNIQAVTLSVANLDYQVSGLALQDLFDGKAVTLTLVHTDHLSDPDAKIPAEFTITDVAYDVENVTFTLSGINGLDIPFPSERFFRTRCRYAAFFGGARCGFDLTATYSTTPGAYPSVSAVNCDGTLEGGNGCRAHGALEAANGLASTHPNRFGGQPGILRGPIVSG